MNERIKELAEQAGLLPREIGPVLETRHMKKKEQDLEKFAELIVKDVFVIIKDAMLDEDMLAVDEIIDDRLQDAAGDVVDAYGIVDRIY